MKLSSPAFAHNEEIDRKYTCEGADVSPPLSWSGAPAGTKSLALVVEDPDAPDPAAPQRIWTHWVVYDLPPDSQGLAEEADDGGLPPGTKLGLNDWERAEYGGPCPPVGRHRYFFRLFALDTLLPELETPGRLEILAAIKGHVLEQTELIGTYQKKR